MADTIRIVRDDIRPNLLKMGAKLEAGMRGVMGLKATHVQNDARNNAPWTDRTGNARNGLTAQAFEDSRGYGIVLFHTMPYGIFLETRWSGRYAIIGPTIQTQGPQVMAAVNKLLARL